MGKGQPQPWGPKGGRKIYEGTFFNCGQVGREKWEFTAAVKTNVVGAGFHEEHEMMGVWQIGNMETYARKPGR